MVWPGRMVATILIEKIIKNMLLIIIKTNLE
jgi:hypothetical protein